MAGILVFTFTFMEGEIVYLRTLIESLHKHCPDVDFYIVDECQNPYERKRNNKLNDLRRVKLEHHPRDSRAYALSVGLERAYANGYDYAILSDSDIIYLPGAIEKMVKTLEVHPKMGVVSPTMNTGCGWPEMDRTIPTDLVSIGPEAIDYSRLLEYHEKSMKTDELVFKDNIFMTDATFIMMKCSVAKEIGGLNRDLLHSGFIEDYAYRLFRAGYTWGVAKTAIVYHCRRGNGLRGVAPHHFTHDLNVLKRTYSDADLADLDARVRKCHS